MQLLKNTYRPDELAEILRICARTAVYYLTKGIVAPMDGRPLRVSREEIARVLELKNLMEEFQILTAGEMAERIGVSANTIYSYHKEERLRCIKLGRTSRFFAADVKNFRRLSD